jgi:hypothetical protein
MLHECAHCARVVAVHIQGSFVDHTDLRIPVTRPTSLYMYRDVARWSRSPNEHEQGTGFACIQTRGVGSSPMLGRSLSEDCRALREDNGCVLIPDLGQLREVV